MNRIELISVWKLATAIALVGSIGVLGWTGIQAWPHTGSIGTLYPPDKILIVSGTMLGQLGLASMLYELWLGRF